MSKLLSITAHPDAPVVCNMTGAEDTLPERLAEYRRLFEHALVGRESTATGTTFYFSARPGVSDWVLDLVRREAACCPFLSYDVDQFGDQIVWTTSGEVGASEMAVIDELLDTTARAAFSSAAIARDPEERVGVPVIVPAEES